MSDDLLKRADALALHTYWAQTPIANVVIDLAARIRELEADLAAARAEQDELRVRLTFVVENISERDFYHMTYPHYRIGNGWSDRMAAIDAALKEPRT